jgi:hypothetical protein
MKRRKREEAKKRPYSAVRRAPMRNRNGSAPAPPAANGHPDGNSVATGGGSAVWPQRRRFDPGAVSPPLRGGSLKGRAIPSGIGSWTAVLGGRHHETFGRPRRRRAGHRQVHALSSRGLCGTKGACSTFPGRNPPAGRMRADRQGISGDRIELFCSDARGDRARPGKVKPVLWWWIGPDAHHAGGRPRTGTVTR